jgi:hypothetical protein
MRTVTTHVIGTSYFATITAARRYYREYGYNATEVAQMLAEGTISIGKPKVTAPDTLTIIQNEGRYAIIAKKLVP